MELPEQNINQADNNSMDNKKIVVNKSRRIIVFFIILIILLFSTVIIVFYYNTDKITSLFGLNESGKENEIIKNEKPASLQENNIDTKIAENKEQTVIETASNTEAEEEVQTQDLKTLDTDNDGLSDYDEINEWLTDKNNPDTDGDGYSDGEEVDNGFNPHGTGTVSTSLKNAEIISEETVDGHRIVIKKLDGIKYLIILVNGREMLITHEDERVGEDITAEERYEDFTFSSSSKYFIFTTVGWEWFSSRIIDLEKNEDVIKMEGGTHGFADQEKYFFTCSVASMGSGPEMKIYETNNWTTVLEYNDLLSNGNSGACCELIDDKTLKIEDISFSRENKKSEIVYEYSFINNEVKKME